MRNKTKIILSFFLVVFIAVWANVAKSPDGRDGVVIWFFDVGQGDSALIQKGNNQILIDGGPDDSILESLGEVMPLNDRVIESVILSHPHADHLIGLNQVLDRYIVHKIYFSGVIHTSNEYLEFLERMQEKNIEVIIPNLGFETDPYENAKMQFIWPGSVYNRKEIANLNNSSIVNRFCFFEECVLFAGDIETDEQSKMLSYLSDHEINIESRYLKVAHHGSNNGTNQAILDYVKPKIAIISVGGDNQFGHPHGSIVDLLSKNKIETKRTDRDGDIKIIFLKKGGG